MSNGFAMDVSDDYLDQLFSHEFDSLAKDMLNEVKPILKESTQNAMRAVVQHSGDSDMINSVKASNPKKTSTDAYIVNVGPSGYSENTFNRGSKQYKVTNAAKAIWLQYGVAGRQPARDWLTHSVNSCEEEVMTKMQQSWERMTGS